MFCRRLSPSFVGLGSEACQSWSDHERLRDQAYLDLKLLQSDQRKEMVLEAFRNWRTALLCSVKRTERESAQLHMPYNGTLATMETFLFQKLRFPSLKS